jgi:hypothetical protein
MLAGDVQSWLDAPTTNLGWMLRGDEGAAHETKRFDSRTSSTSSARPVLTIDFTPVPEPGCGVMALMVVLAIGTKRSSLRG